MNRLETFDARASKLTRLLILAATLVLAAYLGSRASATYLLLGIAAVGILILLRRPGLGLAVLVGLSLTVPPELGTATSVSLTAPVILIPVVFVVWLVGGLLRKDLRIPSSRVFLPLLLFLLSGLLSLGAGTVYWDPLVPRPGNLLLVQLAQWGIFALSGAIFLLAADLGAKGRWLEIATYTLLAVGSVVVLEYFVPPLRQLLFWSAGKMAGGPMLWAWMPALAAGQLLFNHRLRPMLKLWMVGLLLGSSYVVWFRANDSASVLASFSAALGTVIMLWLWRRNRVLAVAVAAAAVLAVVLFWSALFTHMGGEKELSTSGGGRMVLYRRVLEVVEEHPVLGLGPVAYREYARTRPMATGLAGSAIYIDPRVNSHNNYIDIYAQQGLVGLGLFLWFLTELALVGRRLMLRLREGFGAGYVRAAMGGLAGTVAVMMLADWFLPFVYNIGFGGFRASAVAWMFLGGLVALEQVTRNRQEAASE